MLTTMEIIDAFEEHRDEYLKFDRIEAPTTQRRDLMAFNLLDSLCGGGRRIIAGAEHDEIWLEVSPGDLAGKVTLEQVITLIRCGVRCDDESLCMFA
jgi:hypothetical protein